MNMGESGQLKKLGLLHEFTLTCYLNKDILFGLHLRNEVDKAYLNSMLRIHVPVITLIQSLLFL